MSIIIFVKAVVQLLIQLHFLFITTITTANSSVYFLSFELLPFTNNISSSNGRATLPYDIQSDASVSVEQHQKC